MADIARYKAMPNNPKVIRQWLEVGGVKIRSKKPPLYPRDEILAKLANGHTRNDIAKEYGCSLKFLSNLATGKIHPAKKSKKSKKSKKTAKKVAKKTTKKKAKKTTKKKATRKTAKKKTAKRKKR